MSSLVRLLQLASPTLPVGAYSYSQALEAVIDAGVVRDAASAEQWIGDVLDPGVARLEAPLLHRLLLSPSQALNDFFLASRETAELRAETLQMGQSLATLLRELGVAVPFASPAFPSAYACAARHWGIEPQAALVAYLWAWLENQVMAAIKAIPLGQTAGQKILLSLGARLEALAAGAAGAAEVSNFLPAFSLASARHETQYSRLFRS